MSVVAHFRTAYGSALAGHLADRSEGGLRAAYELGRDAVERRLSVLDLAAVHHDGLVAALRGSSDPEEIEAITRAAADFFLESLSAFEMIQRGFSEAQEAARVERRHAEMLRQLSNLLADASLALGASDSLEEMLQLVAEQARELTGARYCLATAALGATDGVIKAASYADAEDARWSALLESGSLANVYSHARSPRGSVRVTREELRQPSRVEALVAKERERALPSWLSAPLTALDGREFGSIELLDKSGDDFTELDEAVLVHLAQMAAAALERARLYQRG
jgi:transcriptional regulator with GAF, ATPase, and Fis domain